MNTVTYLLDLLETRGHAAYLGEPVTQKEHALQAAARAAQDGASEALIAAALLHDIGHLFPAAEETPENEDGLHEERAAAWLAWHFGPEVVEPVRLHVGAKRYLCATDPEYQGGLSPASTESLALQGGPLSAAEVEEFERHPLHVDAVRLRRWDEEAKIPGLAVRGLEAYREILKDLVLHDVAVHDEVIHDGVVGERLAHDDGIRDK